MGTKVYLILLILLLPLTCFPDEIKIPFSVYPKKLQAKFAEHDRKLDLNGNDRTEDSWGFIENKGTAFVIYTYRSATKEDFEIIREILLEGE